MKKEKKNKKTSKKVLFTVLGLLIILAAGLFFLYRYLNPRKAAPRMVFSEKCIIYHPAKQSSFVDICEGISADAILAYMYETNASGRVFRDNWGLEHYILPRTYDSFRKFEKYLCGTLDTIERDDYPSRLLLGLDPYAIYLQSCSNEELYRKNLEFICDIASNNPWTLIYVYLPEDNAEKWNSLSEDELAKARLSYILMVKLFSEHQNIWTYYHSTDEWLLYSDSVRTGSENGLVRKEIIDSYMVKDISDLDTTYMLNQTNVNDRMDKVITLSHRYDETVAGYADLSDKKVIFLGDSVLGNYRNETSIPSFFADMTEAKVYNLGIGGASCTDLTSAGTAAGTAFGYLTGKSGSDDFERNCRELDAYSSYRLAASDLKGSDGSGIIFVLEYGLNDYFTGVPAESFSAALSGAIGCIKETYPESRIVVLSPGYIGMYENGTVITSDTGSVLDSYRDAVRDVAGSYHAELLSLTSDFGFIQEDIYTYLYADAVHYNEIGRYRIARVMAEYFK